MPVREVMEVFSIEKHNKQIIAKGIEKTDCEDVDRIVKTQKRVRKRSRKGYQIHLNTAASLVPRPNHQEESIFSEGFGRMFFDRNFTSEEGTSFGCKPFTSALEVLNSDKNFFLKVLQEPNSRVKGVKPSQTEKGTFESVYNDKFSEYDGKRDGSNEEKHGCTLSNKKRGNNKRFLEMMNTRPSDEIVILKPATLIGTNISSNCSSLQSQRSSHTVPNTKNTSFSFRDMKRKLKYAFGGTRDEPNRFSIGCTPQKLSHSKTTFRIGYDCIYRGVDARNSLASSVNAEIREKAYRKRELRSNVGPDGVHVRKKLDFSSVELQKKQEFDVFLEAKKHLSSRLKNVKEAETLKCKGSAKTLGRILFSPEQERWPLSPRRDSGYCSDSPRMRFSPYSTSPTATQSSFEIPNGRESIKDVMPSGDQKKHEDIFETSDKRIVSALFRSTDDARETNIFTTDNMKPIRHSAFDSTSDNETLTSRTYDSPSSPMSIYHLNMADNIKFREEHQSPDSVLEPFFTEEANSPPNVSIQTERQPLHRRRLDFEEQQDPPISGNDCISHWDYISGYVHSVLRASSLNWDQISDFRLIPTEEFLHASLFEEMEFSDTDSFFDSKLLFDHMNEVLQQIYQSHFCSLPYVKPQVRLLSLENLVLDEIMKEADFYLLPWTDYRTLDQVVSKDVEGSRYWLDLRRDIEQIVIDISEDVMEETVLHTLQEFQT